MAGTFDYYLLVQVMAGAGPLDRDTFVAVMRSAREQLSTEDYLLLQQDIRALLEAA